MDRPAPVRIVIVDDYEVVVRGLARLLAPFAERIDIVELSVNVAADRPADIALYDSFAAHQGRELDVAATLAQANARRLVVYSWTDDADLVRSSMAAGAHGFVPKQVPVEQLVTTLERVHTGERATPETDRAATREPGDWPGRDAGLSERQAEMLALISQGMTNNQIAGRTVLSPNTVTSYIQSTYRKIGVTSRTQAIRWGLTHGFEPDHVLIRRPNDPT